MTPDNFRRASQEVHTILQAISTGTLDAATVAQVAPRAVQMLQRYPELLQRLGTTPPTGVPQRDWDLFRGKIERLQRLAQQAGITVGGAGPSTTERTRTPAAPSGPNLDVNVNPQTGINVSASMNPALIVLMVLGAVLLAWFIASKASEKPEKPAKTEE